MPGREFDEYERDEEMLESRRLKRLEMKRKRKIQQRIVLGVAFLVLVVIILLIVRGCSGKEEEKPQDTEQDNQQQEEVVTPPPADPDVTATLAAVGDIMAYQSQIDAAQQDDLTYNFKDAFSAVSAYTASADITVGNLELNMLGTTPYSGSPTTAPYFNAPEILAQNLSDIGFDILQTANTYSIMNGINGLSSTMRLLNEAGIDAVGTHTSDPGATGGVITREVNGIKFAFIAFTKGVNNMTLPLNSEYCVDLLYTDYNTDYKIVDSTGILERVDAAKATDPDVIVAMLHWGSEYETSISDTQKDIRISRLCPGIEFIHPEFNRNRERTMIFVICHPHQDIECLGIKNGNQKIVGSVIIRQNQKQRDLTVCWMLCCSAYSCSQFSDLNIISFKMRFTPAGSQSFSIAFTLMMILRTVSVAPSFSFR